MPKLSIINGVFMLAYPGGELVECASLAEAEAWMDYLDNAKRAK